MVAEPGGVPGDERVAAVQTVRGLRVASACLLVAVLDGRKFGGLGAAQHGNRAEVVAARVVALEPLHAALEQLGVFAADQTILCGSPRTFQAWTRRSSAPLAGKIGTRNHAHRARPASRTTRGA
jgi:hypothetical protein